MQKNEAWISGDMPHVGFCTCYIKSGSLKKGTTRNNKKKKKRKKLSADTMSEKKEYNFFMLKNPWTERREHKLHFHHVRQKMGEDFNTTQLEPKYILLVRECPLKVRVHTVINCIYTLISIFIVCPKNFLSAPILFTQHCTLSKNNA